MLLLLELNGGNVKDEECDEVDAWTRLIEDSLTLCGMTIGLANSWESNVGELSSNGSVDELAATGADADDSDEPMSIDSDDMDDVDADCIAQQWRRRCRRRRTSFVV